MTNPNINLQIVLVTLNSLYGRLKTNSRIPLYTKARPQQAQIAFCKVHAWHQPHQLTHFYSLPYYSCYKITQLKTCFKIPARIVVNPGSVACCE